MAFVNEFMTKEEMDEFEAKAIPNPGNRLMKFRPYKWTINREENIYMIWALQEREEPHDLFFLFHWKGTNMTAKFEEPKFHHLTCKWNLIYIEIPEELLDQKKIIFESLKEAFKVYQADGDPNDKNNKAFTIEFNF